MRKRIVTYEKQLERNGGFTEIVLEFEKIQQDTYLFFCFSWQIKLKKKCK